MNHLYGLAGAFFGANTAPFAKIQIGSKMIILVHEALGRAIEGA